jgi:RNA polymerase sigma-70 factor (ECF subfamily)
MSSTGEVTRLLRASSQGDRAAEAELIPLVYAELRRRAAGYMRFERPDHTLQATGLVHEAYLKLVDQEANWQTRSHFFGVAAQQMRRILLDHARKHKAGKRAGGEQRVSFQDALAVAETKPDELMAIEDALQRLAGVHPRQARVVELRFYGGYTEDEVAKILETSPETVKRDWKFAKAWLSREIRLAE